MRRNKTEFENLTPDEQQQVDLENIKIRILECKKDIENNTVSLGSYLASVKEQLPHGEFGKWIEDNIGFSERTARRYMKVYKFREDFMTCETIEESDKREHVIGQFNNGQLMELSKLNNKNAYEFINEDTVEELQDLSMAKLSKKVKEFKQSKKSKTDSNDRFEAEVKTPTTQITTDIVIKTDTNKIFLDTLQLNNELRNRVGSDEDIETTLVARYNAKEITHQELSDVIVANKLNLPIFFNEKSLEDYLDRFSNDFYSDYEQYDYEADKREDRTYYSIFARELEYKEAIKCWDDKDEDAIDWGKSNHVDNGTYQLAESYIDTSKYLCIYKDYKLLGTFLDGDLSDIERLGTYDRRNIPVESLKQLKALYEQLQKQLKDYDKRSNERNEKLKKEREKRQKQKEKFDEAFDDWYKNYQPYLMGKYSFSDIWDEKGDIKNFKLWREMTDFVAQEKRKKYDSWKNYDFSKMFGNNVPVIKEEDKPMYKKCYKKLALAFHPDKGGSQEEMQFVNHLKEEWGI